MALNLTVYDIIKGPVLTEKAYGQYKKLKKIVLDIHPQANKKQVAEAIEKLGITIDKKYIKIKGEAIKALGSYEADVRLHKDVEASFKFDVVEE